MPPILPNGNNVLQWTMSKTCGLLLLLLHCLHSMLVLRLQRTGRSRVPTYRVVLAEKSWAAKGRFQEILGHYLLDRDPPVFQVNEERIRYWMKHGAIPSNTLARALQKNGVATMEKFICRYVKRKPKSVSEESAPALQPAVGDSAAVNG